MTAGEVLAGRLVDPALREQRDHARDVAFTGQVLPGRGADRVRATTIFSLIAVTQLGWLFVLGYGVLRLLS